MYRILAPTNLNQNSFLSESDRYGLLVQICRCAAGHIQLQVGSPSPHPGQNLEEDLLPMWMSCAAPAVDQPNSSNLNKLPVRYLTCLNLALGSVSSGNYPTLLENGCSGHAHTNTTTVRTDQYHGSVQPSPNRTLQHATRNHVHVSP